MRQVIILFFCLLLCTKISGQAAFTTPDTVCINDRITISNTSVGASTYYWNFCGYNLYGTPKLTGLGNINNTLYTPTFITMQEDAGTWYGFVSNFGNQHLLRLNYGNSLLNTPTIEDLGNLNGVIPGFTEGLQTVKDANGWHLILVGGQPAANSRIVRVDFGTSLGNTNVTAVNWGNIGNLNFPVELCIIQEGTHYYGLTVNANSNTVTRFDFGTDFMNTPTGTNLGNVTGTLNWPSGIYPARYNGNNYVFVASSYSSSLVRLDFGASVANTPIGTDLGNPHGKLSEPRDLCIINDCGNFYALVVNNVNNDVVRVDFPNGIDGAVTGTTLNLPGLDFPHSISTMFRDGNSLYAFITNANSNEISRLQFDACSNSSTPSSTNSTPPVISYDSPGVYSIHLLTNESLTDQSSFCKEVVVLAPPKPSLGNDTSLCNGGSVTLDAGPGRFYTWNTGATTRTINVSSTGRYFVTVSNGYCTGTDTINITINPPIDITPTVVTNITCGIMLGQIEVMPRGGRYPYTYYLNGISYGRDSLFPRLDPGTYPIMVVDARGCQQAQNFTVIEDLPNIIRATASGSPPTCYDATNGSITVQVNKGVAPFEFFADNIPSQPSPVLTGLTRGNYKIFIKNAMCIDSVSIELPSPPALKIDMTVTDELCERANGSVDFGSSGGTPPYRYYWQSDLTTANTMTDLPAGNYELLVRDAQNCITDTIVTVNNLEPAPVTIWNNDTTINIGESVHLSATNAVDYLWTPADGLSCIDCAATTASPLTTTTYIVTTVNGLNCIPADTVTITVTHDLRLLVPSAFSPNGDGQNDVFRARSKGVAYARMQVFNRLGNLVYDSQDITKGWDGTYKGERQPFGAYVYVIQYAFYGDEQHVLMQKGTVTLVR
jgi:gliding motility-associated-like protein